MAAASLSLLPLLAIFTILAVDVYIMLDNRQPFDWRRLSLSGVAVDDIDCGWRADVATKANELVVVSAAEFLHRLSI